MPVFLAALGVVGTAAMLWVGGGIVIHGLEEWGLSAIGHLVHGAQQALGEGAIGWLAGAALSGAFGLALGAVLIPLVEHVIAPAARLLRRAAGR
jgi:predicted DNA repair protein MutK